MSDRINVYFSTRYWRKSAPMRPLETDATVQLSELGKGNEAAVERLVPLVYHELRRLARAQLRRERPDHSLQTTELVHEAYIKLVKQEVVLIDHARGHLREKRGGGKMAVPLNEALVFCPESSEELLKLDEALNRLAKLDARQSRIVELRFFGGMTVEETAEYLGISPKTVKREWAVAKAWLHAEVRGGNGNHSRTMGTR